MATPLRTYSCDPLPNSGPPGSFLQHLLSEINGVATSAISHDRSMPCDTPRSESSCSKRSSSVWVGGSSTAQDTRDKLRAADEARLRKKHVGCFDDKPESHTPTVRLRASSLDTLPPSSDDDWHKNDATDVTLPNLSMVLGSTTTKSTHPTVGGLRLVTSSFDPFPFTFGDDMARSKSPLMFSDAELDEVYLSSSPIEAPTSAGTDAPTSMTSAVMGHHTTPSDFGSVSPSKRGFSPPPSPEKMYKKTRMVTLLDTDSRTLVRSDTNPLGSYGSIGGDTKTLFRTSTFRERAPELSTRVAHHSVPEPSSFRPEFADSQGQPRPFTPVRIPVYPPSSCHDSGSPAPAETPPWARSMHLVDTECNSIYKSVHGDEWMDSPLCLNCFRRNGRFNRVKTHGYEVCGCEEALQGHYWDPNCDSWIDA